MENKFKTISPDDIETDKYFQWVKLCNDFIMDYCRITFRGDIYKFCWGNNEKRQTMKGRFCRVLARGKMNSCLVEFIDNQQREVVSRNAVRKVFRF